MTTVMETAWMRCRGFVEEHTGYYYELLGLITDAVHIGIQMAIDGKVNFDEDGGIVIPSLTETN